MKKWIKGSLLVFFIILLVSVVVFVLPLPVHGSLFHKVTLTNKAKQYVAQQYGDGYTVAGAIYDFKSNRYFCKVQSVSSPDTSFEVFQGKDKALTDDFAWKVDEKENTISRLSSELDEQVEKQFLPSYPQKCIQYMLRFDDGEQMDQSKFILDMPLDLQNPPHPLELNLWVVCETPSWSALADALKDALFCADRLGWNISYYSVLLHKPYNESEEKPVTTETEYRIYRLSSEEIRKETLESFLEHNS